MGLPSFMVNTSFERDLLFRSAFRHGDIPLPGLCFEVIANRGRLFLDDGIMADVDDLLLKINILPRQTDDLTLAHPRMQGD